MGAAAALLLTPDPRASNAHLIGSMTGSMYAKFFGLKQAPFSIAPDPRYLFMSERHRDALAHLIYGLQGGGGFVLLTGEIGAGKTTVCRCFLEQIPAGCNVAYIFNPKLTVAELLKTVCEEYGVRHEHPAGAVETVKQYVDPLNEFLLRTHALGQHNVLIIDEAQNLSADVLEQLRLLTNLETNERKLLQIVLIGQPELRVMLARPELEQLAQRVIARFHLMALSAPETSQYVRHRLGVAGFSGPLPFDKAALRRIHKLSRGVPRRINLLCDRALLGAYAQGRARVGRSTIDKAAAEVFDSSDANGLPRHRHRSLLWALGGAAIVAGVAVWIAAPRFSDSPTIRSVAAADGRAGGASAVLASGAAASATAAMPTVAPTAASAVVPNEPPAGPADELRLALRNESDAWRELGATWKLEAVEAASCTAWTRQSIECFKSDGGLALLRSLGRPAVLTLHDGSGEPSYVMLVSLTGQSATVRAGTNTQTVSLLALAKQWRGEFATLWRAPPGYQTDRMTGPVLDWLDAQLAKAFGESPGQGSRKNDAARRAKVMAFQRAQGLKSDGLAGPITLMQLNRAAGVDEPRLQVRSTVERPCHTFSMPCAAPTPNASAAPSQSCTPTRRPPT